MKRFFSGLFILLLLITLTNCNNDKLKNAGNLESKQEEKTSYKDIYIKAIEEILKQGPPLKEFKYMAIKIDTLVGTTASEKEEIKEYFQNKYSKVTVEDYDRIKNSLKYDSYIRNGIVIRIDKMNEFTDEKVSFETSVFVVPRASFGLGFEFEKGDSGWNMSKVEMAWIS